MTDKDAQMPELLPCPFCGGAVEIKTTGGFVAFVHKNGNACFYDDAEDYYADKGQLELVKRLWNTRADKAIPPEEGTCNVPSPVIAQVAAALDAYGQLYDTDGDHTESTGDLIRRRGRKALALLQPYVRDETKNSGNSAVNKEGA